MGTTDEVVGMTLLCGRDFGHIRGTAIFFADGPYLR
jgi:hypothetical protein